MKNTPKIPKHGRLYAILKRDESGQLLGYVEHSFSMSWQKDHVRVWRENSIAGVDDGWRKKLFSDERYHEIEKWIPEGAFLVRLNSKNCPIKVTMPKGVGSASKYGWRNQYFTVK